MGSDLEVTGPSLLSRVPAQSTQWTCRDMEIVGDDKLVARFDREDGTGQLEVTVGPREQPGPVFRTLSHCSVRYRGRLDAPDDRARAEVAQLVHSIGMTVDHRLQEALNATPGSTPTLAEALGRRREKGAIVFSRDTLLELLRPEIALGAELAGGWMLHNVYPASHLRDVADSTLQLVLDFRRTDSEGRMRLVVSPRRAALRGFAHSVHFELTHDARGGADEEGAALLRTLVAFVMRLRDHEELEVRFPSVASDVQALLLSAPADASEPAEDAQSRVLNLAISSECHQQCGFCSVKELEPARDGGDAVLARLCADLLSNREAGVLAYRLNGYDPLTYSRVLEVVRYATRIGYRHADIFSPSTTLAERAFCKTLLDALPAERCFHVPLYAVTPEVHDRSVGRPGAHALVMRALDNLCELAGPASVRILSVAMRENLAELALVAEYAATRGLSFSCHLPYPSHESRTDRFFTAMPRQTEVAEQLARSHGRGAAVQLDPRSEYGPDGRAPRGDVQLRVEGVAPCVVFRRMRTGAIAVGDWLHAPNEPPVLPGTEYRGAQFRHRGLEVEHSAYHAPTVPCPHAARCALATACAQELHRSYVELYGATEFQPVSLRALLDEAAAARPR